MLTMMESAARPALRRLAEPLSRRSSLAPFTTVSSRTSAAAAAAVQPRHSDQSSFDATVPSRIPVKHEASVPVAQDILRVAVSATRPRNDWTRDEIASIYEHPLMDLVHQAVRARH